MNKPERLILRVDYDPYREAETILACFPDDEANLGRICAVPMYFRFDRAWFEPFTEISLDYYYGSTKPLKDAELAERCKVELEKRYSVEFKIVIRR